MSSILLSEEHSRWAWVNGEEKLYLAYDPKLFQVARTRSSPTKGGVFVFYGDLLLATYGADLRLDPETNTWESPFSDEDFINALNGGKEQLARHFERLAKRIRDSKS